MIEQERLRKFYNEYVNSVQREAKKGAMKTPKSYAEWSSEVQMKAYRAGDKYLSNTEIRDMNKIMVNNTKNQLSRKQRRALERSLEEKEWKTSLEEEEKSLRLELANGVSPEKAGNIRKRLEEIARDKVNVDKIIAEFKEMPLSIEGETEAEKAKRLKQLREWTAFEGKAFTDRLEDYNISSWHIFFNS